MSSYGSNDGVVRTEEGLFVTLRQYRPYVILRDVPPYTENIAVDARGREFPLKVAYANYQYLLRSELKDAVYPVTFELRTQPDLLFCSLIA